MMSNNDPHDRYFYPHPTLMLIRYMYLLYLYRYNLHHCARGSIQEVPHRLSLGAAVSRQPDDQCWVHGGTTSRGNPMEMEKKKPTCERGEDKDNGVWH